LATNTRPGRVEITSDGVRLLAAWNSLAEHERAFFLREIEASAVFWNCRDDDGAVAFLQFMRTALAEPAEKLPSPAGRALDVDRVRQFANAMVEQIEAAYEASPRRRQRLAHGLAKALGSALASDDREERCGAQLALSALLVQLVELVNKDE
jgi:hypothetical protein